MAFILTAVLLLVFFGVLLLGHELGHFISAKLLGFKIDEFGFGFPPKIFSKKVGETEYSLNLIPFGAFVKVRGLEDADDDGHESELPAWKKAVVFIAGIFMNFLIGWIAFSFIFMIGAPKAVYVSNVVPDSPAAKAGIVSGDKFSDYPELDNFISFVRANPGREISLNVDRMGGDMEIKVTPESKEGAAATIGVELMESGFDRENPFLAVWSGLKASFDMIGRIVMALVNMFRHGDFSESSGPIGIFKAVNVAKDMGVVYFLQLLGVVSLNLTVFNFLPLPALDGGHLLFLLMGKIRGKPISLKVRQTVAGFCFIALLLLMFIVTIKDVINLF